MDALSGSRQGYQVPQELHAIAGADQEWNRRPPPPPPLPTCASAESMVSPSIGKEAMTGTANTVPRIRRLSVARLSASILPSSASIFSSLISAPKLLGGLTHSGNSEQVALRPGKVAQRHFPRLCFAGHMSQPGGRLGSSGIGQQASSHQ